jgi:[FeFe] hydrogenase H-cluster maturation GTPase HydF
MQKTPKALRPYISLFGKRNSGKSSLINALTNQNLAIVSDTPGTTTDPVEKAMELLPFGPVVFVDTAGLDDLGELGNKRVEKSVKVLDKTDVALIVVEKEITQEDKDIINLVKDKGIDYLIVFNKSDLYNYDNCRSYGILVSAKTKQGVNTLKEKLIEILQTVKLSEDMSITAGLIKPGGYAILVVPIDKEAPAGRLILPQVQTIRDILDNDAFCIVVKERELYHTLSLLNREPDIVITDSQAFLKVSADVPDSIPMTSFSILFANLKGDLETLVKGARQIDNLNDGDTVLIAEACTHHAVGDDIGTVKIPRLLRQYTGKKLNFEFLKGRDWEKRDDVALVIHCGGCMLNKKAMLSRINYANNSNIPITNYGMTIAFTLGIFERALEPFGWN